MPEEIKISTPVLKKLIGTKVKYTLKSSYNDEPRFGIIKDVIRRQVDMGGDYIPFDRIKKIELI